MPKKYSAGAVKHGFWFEEFKKYIYKLQEGYDYKKIKKLQTETNFMLAPSLDYGNTIINVSEKKIKYLPSEIVSMFKDLDLYNQRLINFIAIMQTNLLLYEFMNEIYRVHININNMDIEDIEYKIFIKNKSDQEPEISKYTDVTLKRLMSSFKSYMREAKLIEKSNGVDRILKPIIDRDLLDIMQSNNMEKYKKVLMGD